MSLDLSLELPGCESCGRDGGCVFYRNITHNLGEMAVGADLYRALWRPKEIDEVTKAGDLIPILEAGLQRLESDPDHFRTMNPSNGWGSYEGLVDFTKSYLEACREYPEAVPRACR